MGGDTDDRMNEVNFGGIQGGGGGRLSASDISVT